jgi:LysR family transcriptional activator of glutamate synthase operon
MTFRQMEFLAAVCEHKSISKASCALCVSQQGISKAIRELEEELGCELLSRTPSGVTLTQYGAYVLEECQLILRKKDYMAAHVLQMKSAPKEPLLVGMAYGVVAALPPNFLAGFVRKYPDIALTYSNYPDLSLEEKLHQEEFDLGVTLGPVDRGDFNSEILKKEPVYLCIPRTHPLSEAPLITMKDLIGQSFVMFSTQFHICHNFLASCRHAGFEPNIVLSSSDFNSLRELAQHSGALFVVPEHTVRDDDPQLRYYPFPDRYYTWDICFVTKKNRLMTENILAFYQYLKDAIEEF